MRSPSATGRRSRIARCARHAQRGRLGDDAVRDGDLAARVRLARVGHRAEAEDMAAEVFVPRRQDYDLVQLDAVRALTQEQYTRELTSSFPSIIVIHPSWPLCVCSGVTAPIGQQISITSIMSLRKILFRV